VLVPHAALSHSSELTPEALLAALARRVRPDTHRRLFTRVDVLVGELDGAHVWLRPVVSRWENPLCEFAGIVERRGEGSALLGELRIPRRGDRFMVAFLLLLGLALAIPVAIRDSPAAALVIVGVMSGMRLGLQGFCAWERAEILRVVRVAEAEAVASALDRP
jgi:hypothetical protein